MAIDVASMPKLGFGLMRLPLKEDESIDIETLKDMVDAYMRAGLNYFDSAYVYHGGNSEKAMKEALVDRYDRDEFKIATKLPVWAMKEKEDADRIFNEQLERAGVDYFDLYLLHSVEDGNIDKYNGFDLFEWGKQKKAEGKIKHFGFSFHGNPELLEELLDTHPEIEFVQIQYNYADRQNPVVKSQELYQILRDRNIPIIVMEPVKGGSLANLTPNLEEIFQKINPEASNASWALRFVGSQPGVMTILSGMSSREQMEDNLKTFADFKEMSPQELEAVDQVTEIMMDRDTIGCTACRYCVEGCPMHISIPDVFRAINTMKLYGDEFRPKSFYKGLLHDHGRAADCIACGQCEGVCPQHLHIIELLAQASEALDS